MKVYVVEHGERNNGGWIVSVHKNKANAVEMALKQKKHFDGEWMPHEADYWTNGCDYVMVMEEEVLE